MSVKSKYHPSARCMQTCLTYQEFHCTMPITIFSSIVCESEALFNHMSFKSDTECITDVLKHLLQVHYLCFFCGPRSWTRAVCTASRPSTGLAQVKVTGDVEHHRVSEWKRENAVISAQIFYAFVLCLFPQ